MQRRTLIYSIVLVILGIAIAVVVVLILRKRAAGPEIIIVPSGSPTAQTGQAPPKGTQTGEPTKPRDSYQKAVPWKEGDASPQSIYRPEPLLVPET